MDGIEEKSQFNLFKWFLISLIVVLGIGLVGGGIYVYQKALKKEPENENLISSLNPISTLTPEETKTPTPTSLLLKRSDLKIKILNGSGASGAAGKAASFLEELGYEEIKTGNANSFDYEETVIQIKKEKENYLTLLKEDLGKKYILSSENKSLSDRESFDIVIIIGKRTK